MNHSGFMRVFIFISIVCQRLLNVKPINSAPSRVKISQYLVKTNKASEKHQSGKLRNKQSDVFIESDEAISNVPLKYTTNKFAYKKIDEYFYINSLFFSNISNMQKRVELKNRSLTSSFIEFYNIYNLDKKKQLKSITKPQMNHTSKCKLTFSRSPFFLYDISEATCKSTLNNDIVNSSSRTQPAMDLNSNYKVKPTNKNEMFSLAELENETESFNLHTVPYDRIKFFEIYDSDTPRPTLLLNKKGLVNENNSTVVNPLDRKLDNFTFPKKIRHVTSLTRTFNETQKKNTKKIERYKRENNTKMSTYFSKKAAWSDYPFVAVYVYEPAQVHCDCASISTHWLVGAATCLYRYRRNVQEDNRSPYVSYCSSNWRLPGRIAYVSQSIIHPQFHARNYTRRQLYNIGAIQVVNSMSHACNGWRPISLMSHHFVPDGGSSGITVAVGWGLDRYDTKSSTTEIPEHPLMIYSGPVYSNSCPGNAGYSEVKQLNEASVKNVYCLSLPPYTTEEHDPVHGSLLITEDKLIAVYSQEERRIWGDQSALYSGIWQHIPWLSNVAHEDDFDFSYM